MTAPTLPPLPTLPVCDAPALLPLEDGAALLLCNWKREDSPAYTVPACRLEDVRRALALSPVLSSPDVTP
ncbi:MAG: hypothetical protein Q4C89_01485 [Deinococcus sp.]|uniref:hypothetical protein n=1 Tax=Deinococcus sp. TaxID=47478 RepID=UPI0026DBD615|nr:hypothetical protein [Deinococcus sp.]MDO4244681.1 hypothetical protein [Deinococcus sp.]